jgi:hypothetical protein
MGRILTDVLDIVSEHHFVEDFSSSLPDKPNNIR